MKKLLTAAFILTSFAPTYSQTCGNNAVVSNFRPNTSPNGSAYWVNVYYHIAVPASQQGGYPSAQLCNLTSKLNQDYNKYGIYFNALGFDYIVGDNYFNLKESNGTNVFTANVKDNAINIYLINSYTPINTNQFAYGGCAKDIQSDGFWALNSVNPLTLSH
ncbi:hypothetical protein [Fibrella aquatilis]|uniref:Secreted protein n=1 Tax=Fibrella aquatilis TaxID=2817059 RepID=A0A939K0G8_9BACT|nr:hypothetical protein [Fibrella aquatilis]MBO0934179.1 hypothetical protein [Fibrella aquatilis]